MVTLTPKAAEKIKSLASKEGKAAVLRIKVGTGGCSGMSYDFQLAETVAADDIVFEANGAKAVVDPRSDFFIGGSELDYLESMMESGFKIQNPQAKSSCSCGKSFTV